MVNTTPILKRLWRGRCTVYVKEPVVDPQSKQTTFAEKVLLEREPCKLSYESSSSAYPADGVAGRGQTIKLFLDPRVEIPAGSKIVVTQHGKTTGFQRSGEAAHFSGHQEIVLELLERWA